MSSESSLTDQHGPMSGYNNGRIILDEARKVYYAGQVLSGKIEFELDETFEFKAINLVFHGEASVFWKEKEVEERNGQRRHFTVDYSAQEVYFHVEQCVCGGAGLSQLTAGGHSIPFRFQIPHAVPSSFDDDDDDIPGLEDVPHDVGDKDGDISYYVKAIAEYADGERDELTQRFRVVVPLDLNLIPDMKIPREIFFEEALNSFFCGSGLLRVAIGLPATGFCPGQTIPVMVKADNRSSVEVTQIIFELVRRVKYISTDPPSQKIDPDYKLASRKTGAILAKTEKQFTCNFVVPALIAAVTDRCGIIKVGYFLKVKLKLSGCNDVKEDEVEIALGHIPLRELIEGEYEHPLARYLPQAPVPKLDESTVVQSNLNLTNNTQIYSNYPDANRYPAGNVPSNGSYPGANPSYPSGNTSYPGGNSSYPGGDPSYPDGNFSYPGGNTSYPGGNSSYPGGNPSYPAGSPSYPGGNSPYPGTNPTNTPYPTNPSPYAPASPKIGFVMPGTRPGYAPSMGAPPPYNPSAPPE